MELSSTASNELVQTSYTPAEWADLLGSLRTQADHFSDLGALVDGATLIRRIVERIESLLTGVTVGQKEAAELSGYSTDHIRRLERQGHIPNWGNRHSPRYPVSQIPIKGSAARFHRINSQRAARGAVRQ